MVKVCIVSQDLSPPDANGYGGRVFDLARGLCETRDVILVSAEATHLANRRLPGGSDFGFRWITLPAIFSGRSNRLVRMINWILFSVCIIKVLITLGRKDVVIFSSPPLFSGLSIFLFSRLKGYRVIFDVRDLWPETIVQLGAHSRFNPFIVVLRWIEVICVSCCSSITSSLPGIKDYVRDYFGNDKVIDKAIYIKSGRDISSYCVDISGRYSSNQTIATLQTLRRDGKYVVAYMGTVGEANGVDKLLALADYCMDQDNLAFVVIGKGGKVPFFREETQTRRIRNTYFLEFIPQEMVATAQSLCDALFLAWEDLPLYDYGVSPNKYNEYMLSGKAIYHFYNGRHSPFDDIPGIFQRSYSEEALQEFRVQLKASNPGEVFVRSIDLLFRTEDMVTEFDTLLKRFLVD